MPWMGTIEDIPTYLIDQKNYKIRAIYHIIGVDQYEARLADPCREAIWFV